MAVSRKLCGAVIGQKGQTIRDFMADSGATIRVQPLSDIAASLFCKLTVHVHVHVTTSTISQELAISQLTPLILTPPPLLPQHTQVKMAVSRKLCGAVIGQKGQTIRDFMADSGATIRVQPLPDIAASRSCKLTMHVHVTTSAILQELSIFFN
jgi:RNA-binding protein Nova